tara:strand:+ start:75 stop:2915 length:2841 start_codon:yes stop_codon:yes gene_type:complete
MDIKQQTKNVAAQGRFGDSMLLHVNPAEVKGLASAMPITMNPETGQPEAFLPFLAPMLGSLLGPTVLGGILGTGTAAGLSAAALSGIGAGLATYAQTGGSGSKALLSGLTAGMGAKALNQAAQGITPGVDAATSAATDTFGQGATGGFGTLTGGASQSLTPAITDSSTILESGKALFNQPGGFDAGMKSLAGAAMTPSGLVAGTAAGTGAVIQSQEEFERQMAQLALDEEERKKRMYEMYPEQIPVASGGKIGFQRGRNTNIFYDPREDMDFDFDMGNNLTGQYQLPARRTARPIPRGFMPGFQPEFSYFESINPTATSLGFGQPQGFNQNQGMGFNSFAPPRMGRGFPGGPPLSPFPRPIQPPMGRGFFGRRRPPMFAGYGNPFMQSPTYQGFYGVPQMQQMLNPYARFVQQPMPFGGFYGRPTPPPFVGGPVEPPFQEPDPTPPPPVADPVPDPNPPEAEPIPTPPISEPPPTIIGPTPPRKGGPTPVEPIIPPDEFIVPPPEPPRPIDRPMPMPPSEPPRFNPIRPPSIGGPGGGNFIPEPEPVLTPPPSITIPIEGGADVTIPDFSRPRPEPMPFEPKLTDMRDSAQTMARPPMQDMIRPMSEPKLTDMMARPPIQPTFQPPNMPVDDRASRKRSPIVGGNVLGGGGIDYNDGIISSPLPPVQSVTTPMPIGQQPQPPRTGGIPVTGGGPIGSGILPEANLPSGTPTPSGPVDPRIGSGVKIPTGPTMGNITAAPTPRPPINLDVPGPFGGPLFAEGESTNKELPNEGLKALAKTEKGREAIKAMGYQEGQDINMPTGQSTDMMMQDPIVQETIQFILGETDDSNIVNEFIVKYGQEQFMMLRNMILAQAAGNPNVQTEGLIQGTGRSGMADDLPMNIGNKPIAAVSQDEYIIPADVVSMMGDGSSDAGAKVLDGMLDRVRMAKTGGKTQAKPLNTNKVLPA